MESEITVTDESFEREVIRSDLPVLVDFWAPWCAPCRFVAPVLTELAAERRGALKIGKLNVDHNRATAERFQITGIPTLILFKEGRPVERIVGALPKPMLEQALAKHIG